MPAEMTVSAEHLTREELVEAEPDRPATGKGRSRKRDKKLEVEAPTAAAAETEAAQVAMLVEAEIEPGAQLPGELSAGAVEPEMTSPAPASRRRGKGKSVAQQAAEADVEAAPGEAEPAVEPAVAVDEAPKKGRSRARKPVEEEKPAPTPQPAAPTTPAAATPQPQQAGQQKGAVPAPPTTGVEIISTDERNNILYHTMRDLRNPSSVVHNVTRKSARRLWLYAIMQHEHGDPTAAELAWHPSAPLGLWRREHRAGASRYDLAARYPDGSLRIFYGVTDEGLVGQWRELIRLAEDADYWGPPPVEK
jgi:hypothetical protein